MGFKKQEIQQRREAEEITPLSPGDGGKRPGIAAGLEQEDGPGGKIVLAEPNLGDYLLCSKIARGMNK